MLVTNFDQKSYFYFIERNQQTSMKIQFSCISQFSSQKTPKVPLLKLFCGFVSLKFKFSRFQFFEFQIFRFPISLVLLYRFPWKSSCALFFTSSTRSASLIEIWVTFMIISKFENYNIQSHIKCWLNKIIHNRFRYKMVSE